MSEVIDMLPIVEDKPTVISEEDALRLENVSMELDMLKAQFELLKTQGQAIEARIAATTQRGNALGAMLRARYQITESDVVDVAKRSIVRK